MKVTVSFKNRSKTVVIENLKKIEFVEDSLLHDDFDQKPNVITENFDQFRINQALDEITFIGDTTFTIKKSSIESLLFES
ncbi:MAG: hypothetical protein LKJ72_01320 [[Lactobacillus] timonensis]|jgi:hypothetical protein|uniref:hypothetical protein n=1 Tax=[Lactobacillus] timonensis TaxID=1970790 RepID=UPI0023565F2C|nr:hypothetical protein [[Lactobacillus] timonensis]MCI1925646.1 hypothetical protein [[Lactobacillus] timonensis]MCI1957007.1 hypothetical protein [[Lactobacillus] timonensis]MCI1970038.1 hypothetical protein [[Lactobacillus] timonensis]MCI2006197.1 hypothetical protein [[Lactobacillus] timonensis]